MEATLPDREAAQAEDSTGYKSRPGALIWFFRKSRDRWKRKYRQLKATLKRYKNRVADVTKSREKWRLKAETANDRVALLETENMELRTQISILEQEKKTRARPAPRSIPL
jgi:chromosome segregation ATPase